MNNNTMWSKCEITALLATMRAAGSTDARYFYDPEWNINLRVDVEDGILVDRPGVMYHLVDDDEPRFIKL